MGSTDGNWLRGGELKPRGLHRSVGARGESFDLVIRCVLAFICYAARKYAVVCRISYIKVQRSNKVPKDQYAVESRNLHLRNGPQNHIELNIEVRGVERSVPAAFAPASTLSISISTRSP
jgi:hypothetical protein